MSHSSQESKLSQFREEMAQLNSEFFLLLSERRKISVRIQQLKNGETGKYSHYDPERERELFKQFESSLKELTIKELLAFSLIMEDQACAMAPGAYPSWSTGTHLLESERDLFQMMNPMLLKVSHLDLFLKLHLSQDFSFLKDF